MIITRTPLRLTLGGGGTDLPSYYGEHGGFVFAMGLDRYVYVLVNRPLGDGSVRLSHTRVERVSRASELEHELAREALRHHGVDGGVDVSSMADVPDGTGLGSSGSYLVGLLAALRRDGGVEDGPQALAEEACAIEIDVLGKRVGKQDQYMAAFGGLTVLDIERDGAVSVRSIPLPAEAAAALTANTHLYYTGVRRSATEVLKDQDEALSGDGAAADGGATSSSDNVVAESLHRIKELGHRILEAIESQDFDGWGHLLHEHWEHKKRLSRRISLSAVDELYDHVRSEYGVLGGKIAGAGGGGFLVLYCPDGRDRHDRLERFMAERGMPRLRYGLASAGARVIADSGAG